MAISLGPRPPYYNPPIEPENFKPSVFDITDISLGSTTTITTSETHNYVVGQQVSFHIPSTYRTRQLNGKKAYVLSIPSTTSIEVDIVSTNFDAFDSSPSYGPTSPQVNAVGAITQPANNSSGRTNLSTTVQGAFQNISA